MAWTIWNYEAGPAGGSLETLLDYCDSVRIINETAVGRRGSNPVVEYRHGDSVLEGYLAEPAESSVPRPGVLVVHAWKGIGDHERSSATAEPRSPLVSMQASPDLIPSNRGLSTDSLIPGNDEPRCRPCDHHGGCGVTPLAAARAHRI